MSQLTGSEFNNQRGSQGILLQWLWARIFPAVNAVLPNVAAQISTSLANYYTKSETDGRISTAVSTAVSAEATARTTAISTAISAETAARTTAISTAVSAETTARTTAITAEASARTTAINNLQSFVNTNFDTKTQVTTKINDAINSLKAGAPAALDTLKEIADKLELMEGSDSTVSTQLAALIATVGSKASIDSVTAVESSVTALNSTVSANKTNADSKADALFTLLKQAIIRIPIVNVRGFSALNAQKLNSHSYKLFTSTNLFWHFRQVYHVGVLLNNAGELSFPENQTWASLVVPNKENLDYVTEPDKGIILFNSNIYTEAEVTAMTIFYATVQRGISTVNADPIFGGFVQDADVIV